MSTQISYTRRTSYQPVTLSLFSGAGGLDIGFHQAGFKIVACVEKEEAFCNTLRQNKGLYIDVDCQIINKDIQLLEPEEINVSYVDFIIGGPPCQSFSAIGRRAGGVEGTQDERGGLFEHYCRLVKHFQPEGFVFENVRGILGSNKGQDWQRIVHAFGSLGYNLSYRILDTADYGVPQHRERLLMVGSRDKVFLFPRPIYGPDSISNRPYISALAAVEDLQEINEPYHTHSGKYGELLGEVPPGLNYHFFTKEMGHPNPVFAWRSRFSDFLYKADPGKPVRTIVAQLGAYSGPFHWKNRKFTLAEFKRLQSFPDDYHFWGSQNTALKQLGNSVPPQFAHHMAQAVLQQFFDQSLDIELLAIHEQLSFDSRKSQKAKNTRNKRSVQQVQSLPLFDFLNDLADSDIQIETNSFFCAYTGSKVYTILQEDHTIDGPDLYKVKIEKEGSDIRINVIEIVEGRHSEQAVLKYTLLFNHAIGNNLQSIECVLSSSKSDNIYVAWDVIEEVLEKHSSYKTMFDIYGHFTEPHPIFSLTLDILTPSPSPLLLFAKRFSSVEANSRILPKQVMQEFFSPVKTEEFDLSQSVRALRELRFDVRSNETNASIPIGYFRCCYPFTISLRRQVSVVWKVKSKENIVANNPKYREVLTAAFSEASSLIGYESQQDGKTRRVTEVISAYATDESVVSRSFAQHMASPTLSHDLKTIREGEIVSLGKTVAEGVATIIGNLDQNKYLYSILMTGLVEKMVNSSQDIRYAQSGMESGYSNRSTDQTYITPFLKTHNLTACAASGAESGRNFERPSPYKLDYVGKPQGRGNREAFLGIFHAVQEEGIDALPIIVLMMALDLQRKNIEEFDYPQPRGLTIQEIVDAVFEHFDNAKGNGRARLPVLAIQAIYQCIVPETSRYKETTLRNEPNRHTGNDKKGWIGDVQVDRNDGTPFEAVEVKDGKQITSSMLLELPRKFGGLSVDRYYILSTEEKYIADEDAEEVQKTVKAIRLQTGCQVIVNGLNRSLWYYLRLISDPEQFISNYTAYIRTDQDVKDAHRMLWSRILERLNGAKM